MAAASESSADTYASPIGKSVMKLLSSVKLSEYENTRDLVEFDASIPTTTALKTLRENKISAAPVYIEGTVEPGDFGIAPVIFDRRSYLGFVSAADLTALVLTQGLTRAAPTTFFGKLADIFVADEAHSVDRALNMSSMDEFCLIDSSNTLAHAASLMVHRHIHRIALNSKESQADRAPDSVSVSGVVTQSNVVRVVHENVASGVLGPLANVPVQHLFPTQPHAVYSLPTAATARQVLSTLLKKRYAGLPLIDPVSGAIVANVSVADVTALADLSAEDAERVLDGPATGLFKDGTPPPPIVVSTTDSLSAALEVLAVSGAHRVYIVSPADRRPVGIISMSDMLRVLTSNTVHIHPPHFSSWVSVVQRRPDHLPTGGGAAGSASGAAASGPTGDHRPVNIPLPALAASLKGYTAGHLVHGDSGPTGARIVDMPDGASVKDLLGCMLENGVSGVPIYHSEFDSTWTEPEALMVASTAIAKVYHGWVDTADIAQVVIRDGLEEKPGSLLGRIRAFLSTDKAHRASSAMNVSDMDPFWVVPIGRSVPDVIHSLACIQGGLHRLGVVDDRNQLSGVLTQSSLLRFLVTKAGDMTPLTSAPISAIAQSDVPMSLPAVGTAKEGLDALLATKFSGAAILDDDDKIVSSLGIGDVRSLAYVRREEADRLLGLPMLDFVAEMRKIAARNNTRLVRGAAPEARTSVAPLTVSQTDTIGTAIELLTTAHAHRVYLVDEERKVTGVVTITDILRAVDECLSVSPAPTE